MTPDELMILADRYAAAAVRWTLNNSNETRQAMNDARSALQEAMELTSQFGGL